MDLHELRSFIENQKLRLLEDKNAFNSRRCNPSTYDAEVNSSVLMFMGLCQVFVTQFLHTYNRNNMGFLSYEMTV